MTIETRIDFKYLKGQEHAKRALEVGLAGCHSVMLYGQPGVGKTTLALAALDLYTHYLGKNDFELVEYLTDYKEVQTGHDQIDLGRRPVIVTGKPCPCGYFGDTHRACICSPEEVKNCYSPAARDLIKACAIHVELPLVEYEKLSDFRLGEPSERIAGRILKAWTIQGQRWGAAYPQEFFFNQDQPYPIETQKLMQTYPKTYNQTAGPDILQDHPSFKLDSAASTLMKAATRQLGLTPRSYFDAIKLGRTIADLADSKSIQASHIAEAVQYRRKMA